MHELKFNSENIKRGHVLIKVGVRFRRVELKITDRQISLWICNNGRSMAVAKMSHLLIHLSPQRDKK
jgi:hypothetical protein